MNLHERLEANSLTPNRALGQNFLTDPDVIRRMSEAAAAPGLPLLEIGPGLGALTEPLLQSGLSVTAVEKDARLADALRAALPGVKVVTADFLDTDAAALMGGAPFSAIGSLPYYATTPISERLLSALPCQAVLMVQKEAAQRFFARPGARVYGPLSVLSQVYYTPEALFDVPAHCFFPQPEVESAVVRLVRRADAPSCAPAGLLRFVRRALAQRRKTLVNGLCRDAAVTAALEAMSLPQNIRAEALTPDQMLQLYMRLEESPCVN